MKYETKLDSSRPDYQFHIDGNWIQPFPRDRKQNGTGRIVYNYFYLYITDIYICLELTNYFSITNCQLELSPNFKRAGCTYEKICVKVTISKKKGI